MCGFGGIISNSNSIAAARIRSLADEVSFRGPDSCRVAVYNNEFKSDEHGRVGVFFNRLAIVDLNPRSNQPFEDNVHMLVFNGEIYNYGDIRKELESHGHSFSTSSDTEVLFLALKQWGAAAIPKLNGMFAFFWLSKTTRKFMLCRDRLGIKPLYYSLFNQQLIFASELQTVMRLLPHSPSVSATSASLYCWMGHIPTPYSILEEVQKLPPGNYLEGNTQDLGSAKTVCYWDAYKASNAAPTTGKDLETVLKQSMERQLHADVPLGLFLSGGVDSSLLAAMVNKYFSSAGPVNFYTVQFGQDTRMDESKAARTFIEGFNNPALRCHTITVDPTKLRDKIANLYQYFDEPFGDHASLLNWVISLKAREEVTVALSGDGADELFWGYSRYSRWQNFTRLSRNPLLAFAGKASSIMPPVSTLNDNIRFVTDNDPVRRHYNLFLTTGFRYKIRSHITSLPLWALQDVEQIKERPDLPALLDIKTYLADAMLYKVDRASMAASLEVRVPYLDNEVLDYSLSLPLASKSTSRYPHKAPLKELLSQLAPHYPINSPKRGFSFPLRHWLKEYWREQVLSSVTKPVLEQCGLDTKPLMALVNDFYKGRNNYFTDVWTIFNLALWIQKTQTARTRVQR